MCGGRLQRHVIQCDPLKGVVRKRYVGPAEDKCDGPPGSTRGHPELEDLVGGWDASLPPPPPSPAQDTPELDLVPVPHPSAITMVSPEQENSQSIPAPGRTGDDSNEEVVQTNGPDAARADGVGSDIQHWQEELPQEKKGKRPAGSEGAKRSGLRVPVLPGLSGVSVLDASRQNSTENCSSDSSWSTQESVVRPGPPRLMEEPDFPRQEPETPRTHQSCLHAAIDELTTSEAEQGEGT